MAKTKALSHLRVLMAWAPFLLITDTERWTIRPRVSNGPAPEALREHHVPTVIHAGDVAIGEQSLPRS